MPQKTNILALALTGALVAACGGEEAPSPEMVARGQQAFAPCATCHSVEAGAPHSIGPNLHGVYGRQAGGAEGFAYSQAMEASGLVWNRGNLDDYLAAPREVVPGTSMIYEGVRDPEEREALIAYLQSLDAE